MKSLFRSLKDRRIQCAVPFPLSFHPHTPPPYHEPHALALSSVPVHGAPPSSRSHHLLSQEGVRGGREEGEQVEEEEVEEAGVEALEELRDVVLVYRGAPAAHAAHHGHGLGDAETICGATHTATRCNNTHGNTLRQHKDAEAIRGAFMASHALPPLVHVSRRRSRSISGGSTPGTPHTPLHDAAGTPHGTELLRVHGAAATHAPESAREPLAGECSGRARALEDGWRGGFSHERDRGALMPHRDVINGTYTHSWCRYGTYTHSRCGYEWWERCMSGAQRTCHSHI